MYKGYYKLPEAGKDKKPPLTTRVFLANALKEFDANGKGKADEQENTACIVEANKQDFLQHI